MSRGQRLQPRDRPFRDAPEHGDRRVFILRDLIVQLAVEFPIEESVALRVGDFFLGLAVDLPLLGVHLQRLFPQEADRFHLLGRRPGVALVESGAELAPAVEHPSATGRRGFEAQDDGLGVVEDIDGLGRLGLPPGTRTLRSWL